MANYIKLTSMMLLVSLFSTWTCFAAPNSNKAEQIPGLARGHHPHGHHHHHHHNFTSPNTNATQYWAQAFSQILNSLANELKPRPTSPTTHSGTATGHSESTTGHSGTATGHSGTATDHSGTATDHSGTATPAPTTTEPSGWDDIDLDDFYSCREALQSVIRRLSTPSTNSP